MNTQLIDSLIKVVQSLPEIEQKELVDKLNQLNKKPTSDPSNQEKNIDDAAQKLAKMGGTQSDLKPIPRHYWGAFNFLNDEPNLYTLDDGETTSLNSH